jgi:hypothetical protein
MLPHIKAKKWHVSIRDRRILVGRRENFELLIFCREPRPAAAKTLYCSVVELLLELIERFDSFSMALATPARLVASALRRHHLPKQGVLDMPADIVAQASADRFRSLAEILEQVLRRKLGQLGWSASSLLAVSA